MILNFSTMSEQEQRQFADVMFQPLKTPEQLKDWIRMFLDLEIPNDTVDPESNSSPLNAIWEVYNAFQTNSGDKNPGYILMSCREGMKTISVSLLQVLLLLHSKLDMAHAAATETQATVGLKYLDGFLMRIEPLIKSKGWSRTTSNKRTIEFITPEGERPFIKVVICSPKGMNSLHANVIFLDELDLADPIALKEAVNIVGYSKGIYGIQVFLSTRKYSHGNMAKAIREAPDKNYKVISWNLIDVTEKCPASRHEPDLPRADRYIAKNLPLKQISTDEYDSLVDAEKKSYELIKDAYAGCAKCPLLPVCKTKLAHKPETSVGGFYKPITAVIQKFKENDADVAEAQLMCWKPGSHGLVYPRFSTKVDEGNLLSFKGAWEILMGPTQRQITELTLLQEIKNLGIPIYAGVDWGFTNHTAIIIMAKMPNGEFWILDSFSAPGLEFSEVLNIAIDFRNKYGPDKWFCDPAMPSHLKSFNKNFMKSPNFSKDVVGGIEAIRSKIVNSLGLRMLKVLDTDNNKKLIKAITEHAFILDTTGESTGRPDDEVMIADFCDALRYIGQNLFPVKGPQRPEFAVSGVRGAGYEEVKDALTPNQQMLEEIKKRTGGGGTTGGSGKKGGFHFSF